MNLNKNSSAMRMTPSKFVEFAWAMDFVISSADSERLDANFIDEVTVLAEKKVSMYSTWILLNTAMEWKQLQLKKMLHFYTLCRMGRNKDYFGLITVTVLRRWMSVSHIQFVHC